MPLTPSPAESVHLEHTLNHIAVARWADDNQRVVIVEAYDYDNLGGVGFELGDYEHAAQLVCLEELDELISALAMQRSWLADQGPSPEREWAVHVTRLSDEGEQVRLLGPFTKTEADARFEVLRNESDPSVIEIQVLQMQREQENLAS